MTPRFLGASLLVFALLVSGGSLSLTAARHVAYAAGPDATVVTDSGDMGTLDAPLIFSDDFNRVNGLLAGDNGWTLEGTGDSASADYRIDNNTARIVYASPPRSDDEMWSGHDLYRMMRPASEGGLDQSVTYDFVKGNTGTSPFVSGPILRAINTADAELTGYFVYCSNSGGLIVCRGVGGVKTEVGRVDGLPAQSNTDVYRITFSATGTNPTTLRVSLDNLTTSTSLVDNASFTDDTPHFPAIVGRAGFYTNTTSILVDNFSYTYAEPATSTSSYTIAATDLWDNGYLLPTDHPRSSAFSRFIFETTADTVTLNALQQSGNVSTKPIAVRVDGQSRPSVTGTSNVLDLGSPGVTKRVEVTTSCLTNLDAPRGCSLLSVEYGSAFTFNVVPPAEPDDRILIFGGSMAGGDGTVDAPNTSLVPRLRGLGYEVMAETLGGDSVARWNEGTQTEPDFTTLANRFASYRPKTIWIGMGSNDAHGLTALWGNLDNFTAGYARLLDDLHAALPQAHIVCQNLMRETGVDAQIGAAILAVSNAPERREYALAIDAQGWIPGYGTPGGAYMQADGVHPNDAGYAFYAAQVDEVLKTLAPGVLVTSGATEFTTGEATSDLVFTVPDTTVQMSAKLFGRLLAVKVNDVALDSDAYTLSEGSVMIALTPACLNSLPVGIYDFAALFTGNVSAKLSNAFTVVAAVPPPPPPPPPSLSDSKDITSFTLVGQAGIISGTDISVALPYGINVGALTPTIIHTGVSVTPAANVAQDFTAPIIYTVTAEDGTTRPYAVTVTVGNKVPIISTPETWAGQGDAVIRLDAPVENFVRITLDGEELSPSNYTVTSGSTIITLHENYLKTLKAGEYTFVAVFTDGTADIPLKISAQTAGGDGHTTDNEGKGGEKADGKNDDGQGADRHEGDRKDSDDKADAVGVSPPTGDDASVTLLVLATLLSLASSVLLLAARSIHLRRLRLLPKCER